MMPFDAKPPRVCVVGQHEPDYPRNVANQRLMRAAGYDITLCHSRAPAPFRTWSIVAQYLRAAPDTQLVFATEGSHRHVPWLKLATLRTQQAIVFDPFISLYNTEVEDRKLYRRRSLGALVAKLRDLVACQCADYLVFDTLDHKDYFFARYRLDKPFRILRVGVDETVFKLLPLQAKAVEEPCQVLFYGTYIPLQGIETIVQAAARLRHDASIAFTLIGEGQERARIGALAERLSLPNLRFVARMPPEQLALEIAAADICLGIFDGGIKAGQVVPNKVVQCAAMGKPIITRRSPAIEREFQDGTSLMLVPANDPDALATAIVSLAHDTAHAASLGAQARRVFTRYFSDAAQTADMRALLDEVSRRR